MKPPVFEYERPDSLRAALDSLTRHGSKAKLLAGGYSLIPMLNLRLIKPGRLIDVSRLAELQYIVEEFGQLRIGALTTHNTILRSSAIAANCPIMVEAYRHVANHSIRNRGSTKLLPAQRTSGSSAVATSAKIGRKTSAVTL